MDQRRSGHGHQAVACGNAALTQGLLKHGEFLKVDGARQPDEATVGR